MAYTRKTRDAWRIEVNYGSGHGWEHEITEYSWPSARDQIRTYRANTPYPVRAVKTRERKEG